MFISPFLRKGLPGPENLISEQVDLLLGGRQSFSLGFYIALRNVRMQRNPDVARQTCPRGSVDVVNHVPFIRLSAQRVTVRA